MNRISAPLRRHLASIRAMIVFTIVCGIVFPLAVTAVAQTVLKKQADGSLVKNASGQVVGSSLLCQEYVKVDGKGNVVQDKDGNPVILAQYFQARPSSATSGSTDPGCNYQYSGGSNLATTDSGLKATIQQRQAFYAKTFNVDPAKVPEDAVTASGSGMDPDISPENAVDQAPAVAKARNLTVDQVDALVKKNTINRALGFLGEKVVNVVTLNLDLDKQYGAVKSS